MTKKKTSNSDPVPDSTSDGFLVVGIGASAGGVQALKNFFSNVPPNSGNAYVVILHLSPEHDSQLAEVIQTATSIPVNQVHDEQVKVEPDHVYVIPPNRGLTIYDGHIATTKVDGNLERRAPVDLFFRALAESHKDHAVSVVLSGTGPNGSMGIKRVKEMGGIVVAQDPNEAEYSDMPRNSIATGLVDYILPISEIPKKINEYKKNLGTAEIPASPKEPADDRDEKALVEIFILLRQRTGHDFTNYKRATVLRRIERRMSVRGKVTLPEYVEFLRSTPDEAQSLLKDLLISVTNFFRDVAAFNALEQHIIPKIFDNRSSKEAVRVWVAGCATGEEAYSLAMLLAERMSDRLEVPRVQIFATDIDETAIAQARSGLYTESDVADVSPERLKQFFQVEGSNYRVRREIREMILFAVHNVTKDPAFSRLDLVTCRNLLIYLNRQAQTRVMETMHFALMPHGYLFLGSSESAETDDNLFVPVDKEHRIFQSRPIAARLAVPVPDISPALLSQRFTARPESFQNEEIRALERLSYTALHQRLLEQYAPPSIVINADYDIVHISERAGRYLQITGGEPSKNLLVVARPELRLELRTALYQAIQHGTSVTIPTLRVKTDDGYENINIIVRPVPETEDPNRGFILVIFEPAAGVADVAPSEEIDKEPIARRLEEELLHTKSQLRATIEQYEVQHEELKASNEELQAINEELRSAAEEIETSKEELQSVNEELSTVNQELKIKIEELSQSNNDFQNLINSTQVGTIFLDRAVRVKMFTQAAAQIFNLIPGDVGRPLSDLSNRLEYRGLIDDVHEVMKTLQPIEREVSADGEGHFLVRVMPYRTAEDRIEGVVITFIDISKRLEVEAELREAQQRLEKALNIETVGVMFFNDEMRIVDCNEAFAKLVGFDLHTLTSGKIKLDQLTPAEWKDEAKKAIDELHSTGYSTPHQKEYLRQDGSRFYGLFAAARVSDSETVEYVIDITSQKQAERDVAFQLTLLETVDQAMIATDRNGTVTYWSPSAEKLYGWTAKEAIGQPIVRLTTPTTALKEAEEIMKQLRRGKSWNGEFEVTRRDGSKFLAHIYNSPIFDKDGKVIGIVGVSNDITEMRRTEQALREFEDRTRILVESATDYAIFTVSADNVVTSWSPGAENVFGFKEKEIVGKSAELLFVDEDRARGVPRKEIECARDTGRAEDERWHRRKDGSRFFASGVMQPLRSDGEPGFVKICRDMTEKLAAQDAVRERATLQSIVRTQEDERRRIARELHDTLGQQLTALRLKLEAVKANYNAEPAMVKAIDETQGMAKQIDDDLSFLNWELRPTALDNLGLRNALANYVEEWSKNFGIKAEFHTSRTRSSRLLPETEINLYRICQEALNNVMKHAKAKKVNVLVEFRKDEVVLMIEDDGRGFNVSRAVRPSDSGKGLGIVGMRERATLLGGKFEIESARGKGTTVIARVPARKVPNDGGDQLA